jgi:hypothetical protein
MALPHTRRNSIKYDENNSNQEIYNKYYTLGDLLWHTKQLKQLHAM